MSNPSILIVDDNPGDQLLFEEELKEIGDFEISAASTKSEALATLAKRAFDVIFLDLRIPDSAGPLSLVQDVRAAAGMASIVAVTGVYMEKALDIIKAGAKDFLIKACYGKSDVEKSIQVALEEKRSREQFEKADSSFKVLQDTANLAEAAVKRQSGEMGRL